LKCQFFIKIIADLGEVLRLDGALWAKGFSACKWMTVWKTLLPKAFGLQIRMSGEPFFTKFSSFL